VIAVWSAAKGLTAVRYGLNEVYRSRESRNYLIIRSISAIYTVLFVVLILFLIPLNMFGTQITLYILNSFPSFTNVTLLVYSIRSSATFILLFFMFTLMYTIVPSKKVKFRKQIPGALLAAFLWVCVTKLFSIYIDYYASKTYMYGSLTTVILLMFWMYFVIYFIFIGAQLNEYLHVCRKRNAEYELKKYQEANGEVWDDDDIDDLDDLEDLDDSDDGDDANNSGRISSDSDVEKLLSDLEQDIDTYKNRRKTDKKIIHHNKNVVEFDSKKDKKKAR
jgi:membrane protein